MISVSDNQLRIVAEAADRLPAAARGTFLRRVVAEVREGRSFKDSDIERAVRVSADRSAIEAGVRLIDGPGRREASLGRAHCFAGGFIRSSVRRIRPTDCRFSSPSEHFRHSISSTVLAADAEDPPASSGGILNRPSAMYSMGRSTSLVSAKSWRA